MKYIDKYLKNNLLFWMEKEYHQRNNKSKYVCREQIDRGYTTRSKYQTIQGTRCLKAILECVYGFTQGFQRYNSPLSCRTRLDELRTWYLNYNRVTYIYDKKTEIQIGQEQF